VNSFPLFRGRILYERLLFASEIERAGTRQTLADDFPLGKLWYPCDTLGINLLMDADLPCSQETFFRYAATTPGPACLLVHSCYNLSMMLHEPPLWMVRELRRLYLPPQ
jgi:hypothetical protein